MAITTLDGAIAGMQPPRGFVKASQGNSVSGKPQSYWGVAGIPGPGSYDATLNGAVIDGSLASGGIPRSNPGGGAAAYLARLAMQSNLGCVVMLCDRLWSNQLAVNSTGLQSITTPTWPARDVNGSTNGDGVFLALETSTAASATAPIITVSYTNQSGTSGRISQWIDWPTATATIAGQFFRIGLQSPDLGVRSVQSVSFSPAWTSGTLNLVAYRTIAQIELGGGMVGNSIDLLTGGMPRIYDNSALFFVAVPLNSGASGNMSGTYTETQG